MENRFTNRYHSFCKCLRNLQKSLTADPADDFVLKDILVKSMGITDFAIGSPREVLRAAFTNGLIDSDMWLQMLKCRNALAHDYDGEYAMSVFQQIITEYYRLFIQLRDTVEKYYADPENDETFRG